MFDKNAQRERAQQVSAELAAKGCKAPTLAWPVPKVVATTVKPPVPIFTKLAQVKVPVDITGKQLNIGDQVAYTRYMGSHLMIGTIIGYSQSKKSVKVIGKKTAGSYGETEFYKPINRVVKINQL